MIQFDGQAATVGALIFGLGFGGIIASMLGVFIAGVIALWTLE